MSLELRRVKSFGNAIAVYLMKRAIDTSPVKGSIEGCVPRY